MTDRYQWWTRTDDNGKSVATVFRMLNSVTEECALFTVPTHKLAEQIMWALRTAYGAGSVAGVQAKSLADALPKGTHQPTREPKTSGRTAYVIPERTYTLWDCDSRRRHELRTYTRPALTLPTHALSRIVWVELNRAFESGFTRGNETRESNHKYCHGTLSGPCLKWHGELGLCANCGRQGRPYTFTASNSVCDRFEVIWLTAEVNDWRKGDKLCAECVASHTWGADEWQSEVTDDGFQIFTHR